ncbi:MAG TPA: NAD(P)/FAD-dependent oxidoreductase [Microlunatus sp.]|nr:NAD(P)/FAD-dependent oxidoreductase [Microlunatus sp.]
MTDNELDRMDHSYDVVVIGGGAAGLNGALMLARSRRTVLVIDGGQPRNAPAEGVHGLLGHDGRPPGQLLARGREEVRRYGGHVVNGRVVSTHQDGADFSVTLQDGRTVRARRMLVATGLVDEFPDIPGLEERWGRDVLHCPYCHGWEVRDRRIGVLATSDRVVHQALLFRQLSEDVTVFLDGLVLDPEPLAELVAREITVVADPVDALEIIDDAIAGVRLDDDIVVPCEVVAVQTRMAARADFLGGIGLLPEEHPMGVGTWVPADNFGRTRVPGVWVAGNVTDVMAQVGASAAAGASAGAQINADLVAEETRAAVAARAGRASALRV